MPWFLNPALTRFRNEVNARWPNRDKASDGTIGDAAHQATSSDHNPDRDGSVDAWDMDVDGVDVQKVIAAALRHESIQYVIYNRRITSRSWGLGTWRPYTGASPHTEHCHFNTRESHENSSKPWFIDPPEDDMPSAEEVATAVWFRDVESGAANEPAWRVLDKAGEDAAAALVAAKAADAKVGQVLTELAEIKALLTPPTPGPDLTAYH